MIHRLTRASLFAPLLFAAVGCGSAVRQPTAAFASAAVGAVSETGLTLNVGLDVRNPNAFALPITAAGYKIGLGGTPVADGTAKPAGSIPANGALPVTIPVGLRFEDLLKAEKAIASSGGRVPYRFDGELEFSAGPLAALGKGVKVPVSFSDTLDLRKLAEDPVALMKSPAGRKLVELVAGQGVLGKLLGR